MQGLAGNCALGTAQLLSSTLISFSEKSSSANKKEVTKKLTFPIKPLIHTIPARAQHSVADGDLTVIGLK